jgi:hypothetical protein
MLDATPPLTSNEYDERAILPIEYRNHHARGSTLEVCG